MKELQRRKAEQKAKEDSTFLMLDKFTRGAVEKKRFDFDKEKKRAEERKQAKEKKRKGPSQRATGKCVPKVLACITVHSYATVQYPLCKHVHSSQRKDEEIWRQILSHYKGKEIQETRDAKSR